MENLKNIICKNVPYFCSAGMQAQKSEVEPEPKETSLNPTLKTNNSSKPWSVFGDVYWI